MQHEPGAAHAAPLPLSSPQDPASPRSRIRSLLWRRLPIALAALVGVTALVYWDVSHTGWYKERQYTLMSLAALRRERDAHNSFDPLLLYYIGLRLNEQGKYSEADGFLREAVVREPESTRFRDEWTRALVGAGLTTAAFGQLKEYAGTHPGSAEAHLLLGKFYATQNSMKRAAEELETAVRLDPGLGEAWSYLAAAQQGLNQLGRAREAAENAVHVRPRSSGDHLMLAGLRANTGDQNGARKAFAETLALSPNMAVAHREYARWLLDHGSGPADNVLAVEEARHAVMLDGVDGATQLVLGRALLAQGDLAAAVEALRLAAERLVQDPAAALALAQTLRRVGQDAEARQWADQYSARQRRLAERQKLEAALELNSRDPTANRALAKLLAQEGDVVGCVRHEAQALRKPMDSPVTLTSATRDLVTEGHAQEALPLINRASILARANPDANETMGDTLLALNRPDEAAKYYANVLNWRPERKPILQQKLARHEREREAALTGSQAEVAYRQSRALVSGQVRIFRVPAAAESLAREAVRLDPNNPRYLRNLLALQFRANRRREGIDTARKLVQLVSEDARARALLAIMLTERDGSAADLVEAQQNLDAAASDPSCAPTRMYGLGLLALQRGRAEEAVRALREAARLDPGPDVTFYKLSLAEARAGHPEEAAKAMAEYKRRQMESDAEATALITLGMRSKDPRSYIHAAAVFDSFGRHWDAEAIRAAAKSLQSGNITQKGIR